MKITSKNGRNVSRGMREHMAAIVAGKRSMWAGSTEDDCIEAGLLNLSDELEGNAYPTDEGREIGEAEIERADVAKARDRRNAKARSEAMRDLGMRRTRSGGWE